LLALIASSMLTYLAIRTPDLTSLIAAMSFDILALIPLVLLAWQKG
jgi:hypothetical protein